MGSELSDCAPNSLGQAPAVTYPLSPPVFLHAMLLLALCLAVFVDIAWIAAASPGQWRGWVGLLATAGVAGWCWQQRPMTQSGRLSWDGSHWSWEDVDSLQSGTIDKRLDIPSGMLLRFGTDSGVSRWLWLDHASDPGRWLALCRAVHAAARHSGATTAHVRPARP